MRTLLHSLVAAAVLALPLSALSQMRPIEISWTGQPDSYLREAEPYSVQGWRSARFGMSRDEVLAAIRADFPQLPGDGVREEVDPVQQTRTLTLVTQNLAPAPGTATVNYVFGATSQRLAAVNVAWIAEGNPGAAERQGLMAGGTSLVGQLVGYFWEPLSTARGHVIGPGSVILFAGRDEAGGGVEVRLDGVALDVEKPLSAAGTVTPPERRTAPPGPARLRLAVAAQPDRPDIRRLAPGLF